MKELRTKYYDKIKKELFESCAPFWLKYAKDEVYGGIANCTDRFGNIYSAPEYN